MQAMESQFDVCTEDLINQTVKLEEMEKKAGNAEGEVSALRSRLILLQENNEKQEDRLAKATLELAGACQRADGAVRKRTELENGEVSNEESIDSLEPVRGLMGRCASEQSWRTGRFPTRSRSTAWTNSWQSPSSPWPPPRASSTTFQGSFPLLRRTPPGATRGPRLRKRRSWTSRRS